MPTRNPATSRAEHTHVPTGTRPLLLRMSYAEPHIPVLSASGDLDLATASRLEQLLWARLKSTLSALVIDLGEVTFLGVAGPELLTNAHAYAGRRETAFGVVNSSHAVDRALAVSGIGAGLPCFGSVSAAVHACGYVTAGRSSQEV